MGRKRKGLITLSLVDVKIKNLRESRWSQTGILDLLCSGPPLLSGAPFGSSGKPYLGRLLFPSCPTAQGIHAPLPSSPLCSPRAGVITTVHPTDSCRIQLLCSPLHYPFSELSLSLSFL